LAQRVFRRAARSKELKKPPTKKNLEDWTIVGAEVLGFTARGGCPRTSRGSRSRKRRKLAGRRPTNLNSGVFGGDYPLGWGDGWLEMRNGLKRKTRLRKKLTTTENLSQRGEQSRQLFHGIGKGGGFKQAQRRERGVSLRGPFGEEVGGAIAGILGS